MDQLSQAIWQNDIKEVERLIDFLKVTGQGLNHWDCRGNTPLHLAIMLGREEVVHTLITNGASCQTVNSKDSGIVEEAAKLGNRQIIGEVLQASLNETLEKMPLDYLRHDVGNFHMQIEIKLKSHMPALAKLLPSEVVSIWKTSDSMRVDWTIARIAGLKLCRSKMSMYVKFGQPGIDAYIVDHKLRIKEQMAPKLSSNILHDMVDTIMIQGIVKDEAPLNSYELSKSQSKTKKLKKSQFDTEVFTLNNMGWIQHFKTPIVARNSFQDCDETCTSFQTLSKQTQIESLDFLETLGELRIEERRLSSEEVADNLFKSQFSKVRGRTMSVASSLFPQKSIYPRDEIDSKKHLANFPPSQFQCTQEEYFGDKPIALSRECYQASSTFSKEEKAQVYICKDFPLDVQKLLPLAQFLLADVCNSKDLAAFVHKVGPGFPVRIEVPLIPMLKLKASVIKMDSDISVSFDVPAEYQSGAILPLVTM